jgi:NADPH-dependent ferric siderophore reductase
MTTRIRREPPRFRGVEVQRVARLSPRLIRVTLGGAELDGFTVEEPDASIRLLLPSPGEAMLVVPAWNGNEFLLPDGRRPILRTLTPRHVRTDAHELDVDIVDHGAGMASEWAVAARPGDRAAISGPGRGYTIDHDAPAFLLAGDETAIPAMSQLLERMPAAAPVRVLVEIADGDAQLPLTEARSAAIDWLELPMAAPPGDALVAAVRTVELDPAVRVWAAGEAAAMQRLRRLLFDERGLTRAQCTVRGYWKHGPDGDDNNTED